MAARRDSPHFSLRQAPQTIYGSSMSRLDSPDAFERWLELVVAYDAVPYDEKAAWLQSQGLSDQWEEVGARWQQRIVADPELDARYRERFRQARSSAKVPSHPQPKVSSLEPVAHLGTTAPVSGSFRPKSPIPFAGKSSPAPAVRSRSPLEPNPMLGATAPLRSKRAEPPLPTGFREPVAQGDPEVVPAAPPQPASQPASVAGAEPMSSAREDAAPEERLSPWPDTAMITWAIGQSRETLAARTRELLHRLADLVGMPWRRADDEESSALVDHPDGEGFGGAWRCDVDGATFLLDARFRDGEPLQSAWRGHVITLKAHAPERDLSELLGEALCELAETFEPRWGYAGVAADSLPEDGSPCVAWRTFVSRQLGPPREPVGGRVLDLCCGYVVEAFAGSERRESVRRAALGHARDALRHQLQPYAPEESLALTI